MDFLGKALWYIETHFEGELTLDDVSRSCGLSKFHLTRAFGSCYGISVIHYVRMRRLSEAAKRLARGDAGILDVALQFGYGSHEAFTRAFKAQFGVTPEAIQKAGSTDAIKLMEALKMNETLPADAVEPRMTDRPAILLVGLKRRYGEETSAQIPAQWQEFQPFIGHIRFQSGSAAYGVLCHSDQAGHIDYFSAVQVSNYEKDGSGLEVLRLAPQTYAVFRHSGHVSEIRQTWKAIFGKWLPASHVKLADAPQFEFYGETFNPQTGYGEMEIWIPVA